MHHLKKVAVRNIFSCNQCFGILIVKMSVKVSEELMLLPPSHVRGMKKLDIESFRKSVEVPCVSVSQEKMKHCLPTLKKYLLKMRNFNPILSEEGTLYKKILLNPLKMESFFNDSHIAELKKSGFLAESIQNFKTDLTYENWTAEEIFKAVLPLDKESISSFSIIGHIYHVNLRDHLFDYKSLIGEVLLNKNKLARTVVNKINSIDSTYRTFQIEILAGEHDMVAKVRENHCSYEFDFSKVYWNPRLVGEHERIVNELNKGDVLYDVFAGVGPFSIPAARKGCSVLANDLNPESFKWLQHNIKINKVVNQVKPYNKDGVDFIRENIKEDLLSRWNSGHTGNYHITMNLPALAVDFLSNFNGLFSLKSKTNSFKSPTLHVYCFIKGDCDPSISAIELVESKIGCKLDKNLKIVSHVRNVSNKKEMMRVSFLLSDDILFGNDEEEQEPLSKRPCLEM